VLPATAAASDYRLDAVRDYLSHRDGAVGVAVADADGVVGVASRQRFEGASLVKAMLLVGYLRKVDREDRALTDDERDQLRPMITQSANDPATWVYERLGNGRLSSLAHKAHMRQFSLTGDSWSAARFSARDQAQFFWRLERLTPARFRDYARSLLSSIVEEQSWGIARVARAHGYSPFFKGGWGTTARGALVNQAALLQADEREFAVAVLTDGSPSMSYGIRTIRGVAHTLIAASE
jgi:hypothetical protein